MYSHQNAFEAYTNIKTTTDLLQPAESLNFMDDPTLEGFLLHTMQHDMRLDVAVELNTVLGEKARWRVISSLQKCIRRGDVDNALRAAHALQLDNDWYLWKRLCVICLEDIGIANLPLAALVFTIWNKKKLRDDMFGGMYATFYIVEQMCRSTKDRTLCEIANASGGVKGEYTSWLYEDKDNLWDVYDDVESELPERHLAGLTLLGGLKLGEEKSEAHKKYFINNTMGEGIVPYIIIRGISAGTEGLHCALYPLVSYLMDVPEALSVRTLIELPDAPIINGLPSVAYDMHCLEGKRAFAYFRKACEPVHNWLKQRYDTEELWKEHTMEFIGLAVFLQESGCILKDYLSYDTKDEMLFTVLQAEAKGFGLSYEEMMDGYNLIREHLEELNYARRRVLEPK